MKTNSLLKLTIAAVALLPVVCPTASYALVPVSWNASVSNAWENALNWTPALEPTNNTFDVEIGLLTTAPCNLSSGFQIDALTLSNSSAQLNLIPGATLAFTSDVTNNGTIVVDTTAANVTTKLRFDANVQIAGSGVIVLNDPGNVFNAADVDLTAATVTHGINHVIRGHGTIIGFGGATLINNGTINGNSSSGFNMQVDLANTTNQNNGTMEATNGGVLGFYSGTIDQTGGGMFLADGANSIVQFGGSSFATLIGGTVTTSNGGVLLGVLTGWQGVTNTGAVQIPAGDIIVVNGSGLTNKGTIVVDPSGANVTTKIRFDANGALDGNGSVTLNDPGNVFNAADIDLQSFTVTHGANHTIHGHGTIIGFNSGTLINNGTINGDSASGFNMQLDLANTTNQNNATIEATNGGVLGFYSGTIDQTGGGTFLADGANSIVQFGGSSFATLIGGTVTTSNGGVLLGVLTGWQGVTNKGKVQIPGGDIIVLSGTGLTNNGTILVDTNADNATTKIRFDADGTLGGNGTVKLNGITSVFNVADIDIQNFTATHGANHTIHGLGTIIGFNGGTFINNGTINGDDPNGGFMQVDLANTPNQNNSTIKATKGGALGLFGGSIDQTGGGTFLADGANSIVYLGGSNAVTVTGGILNTTNGGLINVNGAGAILSGVTNNGAVQIPGGDIIVVTGTGLTNNGTILVDTTAANVTTKIRFDADGTLGGNGSVTLNGIINAFNVADFDCNGHAVINGASQTIKGNGNIFMNGGSLTNNGMIAPGLSPGHLDYSGTLVLGSTSSLVFEIGGTTQVTQYDLLSKSDGAAQTLGGNLVVRLINNFTPVSTDTFTILTTNTTLQGAFSNVASGQRLATADGHGSFVVTYSGQNNVVLSQFAASAPSSKVTEFSTRAQVKTNVAIFRSTFTISGTDPTKVIIRGLAPSLGITGEATATALQLQDHNGVTIATNAGWQSTQQAAISATGLAPSSSKESAILVTLTPGSYTVILRGEGIAKMDVHDLSPSAHSALAIMSTLGYAGTSQSTMVGDFTIGAGSGKTNVLLRVLGPTVKGAPGAVLQDPTLELDNANGTQIYFNDNWQDTQKTQIQATGLAPSDPRESAIVANLDPGTYTVIARGKNNQTGFARLEVYQLQQK